MRIVLLKTSGVIRVNNICIPINKLSINKLINRLFLICNGDVLLFHSW